MEWTQKSGSKGTLKKLLGLIILAPMMSHANPYIEYKHEHQHKDWKFDKNTQHLRFGYKADNNLYLEAGPMTDGYSWESGYKFKRDKFTFKGKLETKDADGSVPKSKLETEIRYTF